MCGQFKDRQNKSLKIGKQSCKVELYFRFCLTLIENHFSCIYAMAWICSIAISTISRCMLQHQHPTDSIIVKLTQRANILMPSSAYVREREQHVRRYTPARSLRHRKPNNKSIEWIAIVLKSWGCIWIRMLAKFSTPWLSGSDSRRCFFD